MIWLCSVICVFCYFWACNSSLPAVNAQGASVPFTIMKTHKFASVTYSCLDWINGISYAMWFPYVKSQQLPCSTGARICFILFALYKAPPNIRTCFQSCSCFVAGICAPVERVNWTFDSLPKKKNQCRKNQQNWQHVKYYVWNIWRLMKSVYDDFICYSIMEKMIFWQGRLMYLFVEKDMWTLSMGVQLSACNSIDS